MSTDGRRWRKPATAAVVAALLTGSTACTARGPWGPQADSGLPCGEIGSTAGVSVDLSQVLSFEGGDYWAEVSVPSLGATHGMHFAGNDWYFPYGEVDAPLTADPVEVHVKVTTGRGDTAYEASTVAHPVPITPEGPDCDGTNYRAGFVAVPDRGLRPHVEGTPVTDARGRWSAAVGTEHGVELYEDGEGRWRRVGGRLDDGACGVPPGWHTNGQRGWMSLQPDGTLLFEDERGHVERFEQAPAGWEPEPCG